VAGVCNILPHPDFPDAHAVLSGPPSMGDDCGSLAFRLMLACGQYPCWVAEWIPSEEEKALIAAGQPVRVSLIGERPQPSMVWAREMGEV
jgi:hypothetical protein